MLSNILKLLTVNLSFVDPSGTQGNRLGTAIIQEIWWASCEVRNIWLDEVAAGEMLGRAPAGLILTAYITDFENLILRILFI